MIRSIGQQPRPPRTGQVAVETFALPVLPQSPNRLSAVIVNNGPATVYIGFDQGVSTHTGFGLPSGMGLTTDDPSCVYAVAAASGTTVSYIDETRQ